MTAAAVLCAKAETLVPAVRAGGLDEVLITRTEDDHYTLKVRISHTQETFYLCTRRTPEEPRRFPRVTGAIKEAERLFEATRFTVVHEPA